MVHEPSQLNDVGFDRILRSLGSAAPPQCGVILASGRVRATSTCDILKLCEGRGILMDNFGFWADIGAAQKTAAKSPDSKTHDCRNYVPSAVIGVLVGLLIAVGLLILLSLGHGQEPYDKAQPRTATTVEQQHSGVDA